MSATSVNTGGQASGDNTPAPEGHDEQMAKAFDDAQETATSNDTSTASEGGEGGDKILGKFDSQDDLIEAYRNLEAKLSQGGTNEGSDPSSDSGDESSQDDQQKAAEKAVSDAEGVDMESLSQEYMDNGDLSDASYEALEKAGIPRSTVKEYIEGQEIRAQQFRSQALEAVGGEEEFEKMAEWASSNLSKEQVDRYNSAIDSSDPARMQEAVKALAFEYSQARPQEPNLLGGGNSSTAGDRFESVAQLTEAMSDPRYQNDPAYRKEVEQKLARSNVM